MTITRWILKVCLQVVNCVRRRKGGRGWPGGGISGVTEKAWARRSAAQRSEL